ncbi:hypothetical protein BCR44DRAFT_1431614 [Catenaria anguillulae PL171]|uniref:SMP-LTD domain-containing protein n=1 Tax=Catenaria anguillulae PL171 TaxID=765915 RepID=A0A1Y2HQ18_9FUNG|nr:hypothetical protein BCR44DRAFT_1431614 [Catenaria anguillulae PL171]
MNNATMTSTSSNTSDDLVHLIASQATAQFVKGLLLGMLLTVGCALVAARMLLFHSPTGSSPQSTCSTAAASAHPPRSGRPPWRRWTNAGQGGPPLPLPLSTLILLHRQLLAADLVSAAPSATPATTASAASAPPPGSPAALSAAAELSASYLDGESLAFLNFLLAEVISTYRSDQRFMDWLKVDLLETAINKSLPAFVDRISVSDLSLGQHDQFPLFRRARLRPCRNDSAAASSRSAYTRGPRAGSATASAMNERWRIELDIEFENLSQVAKRASAMSQLQAREQQAAAAAAAASGSTGSLSRSGSLRQRKISSSHNSRSGSPRPGTIPLASATFGTPPSASASGANPSPLGNGIGGDRPTLSSNSLNPQSPALNLGEDSLTSEPEPPPAFLELGLDTQLFCATLAIEFHPHTSADDTPMLTLSILPGYKFDFRVSSLLGSRTKLRDVPKIADLITMAVQNQIAGMLVDPAFITVPLPGVPTRKPAEPAGAAGATSPDTASAKAPHDLGHQGDDEHDSAGSHSSTRHAPTHTSIPRTYPPAAPAPMSRWPVPSDRDLLRSPTASPFARASASAGSGSSASLHLAAAASLAVNSAAAGGGSSRHAPPRLARPGPGYFRGTGYGETQVPPVPRQFARQAQQPAQQPGTATSGGGRRF